ncbi:Sec1-like protein [Kipferlia bialata]|uniref:Sec1-like protein n=1 Tax=Kipferlia bialata TaxID=797122 RepID=A0A9K3GMG7_9EUKA|nr:Sec1-like protein [Kipferlia bialata]|eukprot:g10357.t1
MPGDSMLLSALRSGMGEAFAAAGGSKGTFDLPDWRVLVADKQARDVIALAYRAPDLLRAGLTLLLNLEDPREPAPIRCLYVVTPASLQAVCADVSSGTYSPSIDLVCLGDIPLSALESLAMAARQGGVDVGSVRELHTSFLCPSPHFLSMGEVSLTPQTALRHGAGTEGVAVGAQTLTSVLRTLDAVRPVLLATPGPGLACARQVAKGVAHVPTAPSIRNRQTICIVCDRAHAGYWSCIHPAFRYGSLVHSSFGAGPGLVRPPAKSGASPKDKASVPLSACQVEPEDMGVENGIYNECWYRLFRDVAPVVEGAVRRYQSVKQSVEGVEGSNDALADVLSSLPALTQTKRDIDTHAAMAHALLADIERDNTWPLYQAAVRASSQHTKAVGRVCEALEEEGATPLGRAALSLAALDSWVMSGHVEMPSGTKDAASVSAAIEASAAMSSVLEAVPQDERDTLRGAMVALGVALSPPPAKSTSMGRGIVGGIANAWGKDRQGHLSDVVGQLLRARLRETDGLVHVPLRGGEDGPGAACDGLSVGSAATVIVYVMGGGSLEEAAEIREAVMTERPEGVDFVYGCDCIVSPADVVSHFGGITLSEEELD